MYYDDKWSPVNGKELEAFLEKVNPIDGKYHVDPKTSKVSWRTLPFYDQIALIRVQDSEWDNRRLVTYFLADQGELYRLDGTSPPIHEVNSKAPIKLTDDNVLEYLRFFCFFVRGEDGPFLVVEDIDDKNLPDRISDQTRDAIEKAIRVASIEGKNDDDHWLCDAVVYYSNALFLANFSVHPTGMIEMTEDDPIETDLPDKINVPIA